MRIVSILIFLSLLNIAAEHIASAANAPANAEFPILSKTYFNGVDDDLLTAGLGISGLQSGTPAFTDPDFPSRSELRRNSIHYNINALVNTVPGGGFGEIFGPARAREKFSGYEYLSLVREKEKNIAATLLVQIPDNLNLKQPCIVAGPSSGSRGIFGAIGVVGPWALRNGCAIAYTDKGTGTGFYFLDTEESYNAWGEMGVHQQQDSLFAVEKNQELEKYIENLPHRIAIKHAHSQTNVEKDWPAFVLQAIRFAFQVLNTHYQHQARYFAPGNTIVISSGTSNGGNSSIRAAEQDPDGLIDAVVVAEPNLNMPATSNVRLIANGQEVKTHSRKLLDYTSYISLYLPCALLSQILAESPFYKQVIPLYRSLQKNRCTSLYKEGLLISGLPEQQAAESLQHLNDYGIVNGSHLLDVSFLAGRVWEGISAIYTNAYGRYSVNDHICDVSFAAMNKQGKPVLMNKNLARQLASISSGFIGSGGIAVSVDSALNGSAEIYLSQNDMHALNMGLETAICWRQMLSSTRVQRGLEEIAVRGDLHGKPAIIVHGRHDSLIHVNHASRPYYGLNKKTEGERSKLHFYEIEHAQHFDKLLAFPDVARHYIPLQPYLEQALDLMLAHLTRDRKLPPSQVVRTDPASYNGESLPDILETPGQNRILYTDNSVIIP